MRKIFKYRLLSNKDSFDRADNWLWLCQRLYNCALEQRAMIYQQNKGSISCYEQIKQLPELKKEFIEYKEVCAQVLQEVIQRLDRAYQSFFRRIKNGNIKAGYPRYRSRERYDSFTLKHNNWRLEGKYLTINKIGRFKLRLSRPIEGVIKTITILRQSNKWYACFSCDNVPEHKLEPSNKIVGIDVGLKSFCVDSDNKVIDNPKYLKHSLRLLRVRQRRLFRRVKGSNGRKEARLLVAKTHEIITNQRTDFLHKTANYYVENYGKIYVEDLNIEGIVKNHSLAQSVSDTSWGKFFELLKYKAEEAGREVVKIPRFEPSSKTCSACGAINRELKLSDRQWVCKECGVLHDRDYNAAKNIKRVGQTQQTLTCENTQSVVCESLIKLESVNGCGGL